MPFNKASPRVSSLGTVAILVSKRGRSDRHRRGHPLCLSEWKQNAGDPSIGAFPEPRDGLADMYQAAQQPLPVGLSPLDLFMGSVFNGRVAPEVGYVTRNTALGLARVIARPRERGSGANGYVQVSYNPPRSSTSRKRQDARHFREGGRGTDLLGG